MFDSTIELIILAASNSLVIFCFCNLIIVFVLVGGSKPTSHFDQDSAIPSSELVGNGNKNDIYEADDKCSFDKNSALTSALGAPPYVSEATVTDNEVNDNKDNNDEDDELRRKIEATVTDNEMNDNNNDNDNDNDEDDELTRRIEEFIHRINESWKVEKLRTSLH